MRIIAAFLFTKMYALKKPFLRKAWFNKLLDRL